MYAQNIGNQIQNARQPGGFTGAADDPANIEQGHQNQRNGVGMNLAPADCNQIKEMGYSPAKNAPWCNKAALDFKNHLTFEKAN